MKKIFYFQWHITDHCNNRCKHCYIHKKDFDKHEVSEVNAVQIIEDMKHCCEELGVSPQVSITGGDPLRHSHVFKIIKGIKDIGGTVRVLGNPELITEETVKKLIDLKIKTYQVSIDGMEEMHDSIRSKGSFNRTTSAIRLMLDMGLSVSALTTVSSLNQFQIAQVMDYVYSFGIKRWSFSRHIPDNGSMGMDAASYFSFMKYIVKKHEPYTEMGISLPTKDPLMLTIQGNPVCGGDCVSGGCGLGSSMLTILPDNTIMGCRRHAGSILGDWKRKGDLINYFLFHPKMDSYRDITKIKKCGSCKLLNQCRGCRAAAYAATGDIYGVDPHCNL